MNKAFNILFPTFDVFKKDVIDYINDLENNPLYLNDTTFKYSQEKIFNILSIYFKDSIHNYNNDELFIQSFRIRYANAYMNFYFKTNELNKIELDKITNEWFNDINKLQSTSQSNSNATNESRYSTTPVSKQIKDILDELPLNNADRSKIENAITNNTLSTSQVFNGYSMYQKALNSNFSLQFDYLIRKLSNMFLRIENNIVEDSRSLDDDSLTLIKQQIDILQKAIIVLDETKQDKLVAGNNITIVDNEDGTQTINSTGGGELSDDVLVEGESEIKIFNDVNDYNNYKTQFNIDDSYFEDYDIPSGITPEQIQQIETNKNNIDNIKNSKYYFNRVVFRRNIWIPFNDKTYFENIIVKQYNLSPSDYVILDTIFIGHNDSSGTFGSKYIEKENIKKCETNGHSHSGKVNQNSWGKWCASGSTNYVSNKPLIDMSVAKDTIGVDNPTQFIPEHNSCYYVMFQKDIVEKVYIMKEGE